MKKILIIFSIAISIIGCKKELTKVNNTSIKKVSTATINKNIKTENGIIIFATQDDFKTELMHTYDITNADRIQWENAHNVKSLHTIYNEICQAEYTTCLKPHENLSDAESQKIITPKHTDIFYDAVNKGIVKIIFDNEGFESQVLNCSQMNFAPFLSVDGIVSIDNDLLQYRDGKAKCYKSAKPTFENIEKLKNTIASNESEGITVEDLKTKSRASGSTNFGTWITDQYGQNNQTTTGWVNNGLYHFAFDLSYTFNWVGNAINRASKYYFNAYIVLKTEKRPNSTNYTYYPLIGDHYVNSNTTPFANLGGMFSTAVVDVNGNQLYESGSSIPYRTYFTNIRHTINTNDAGQGNGQFSPSFAFGDQYAPLLSTYPLNLVQGYFATDPTPYMHWKLSCMVPGGSSGFSVWNVK